MQLQQINLLTPGRRTVFESSFSSRQAHIQIHDVDGSLWNVHDASATKHGFDLLFGLLANSRITGAAAPRKPRLIGTPELFAYWDAHRYEVGATFDLPASRSALSSLRRQLHFNFIKDRRLLWQTRAEDLKNLSMHEFANRYNVDFKNAEDWRLRIIGRVLRPSGWWKTPETLSILRSPWTLREIGAKLGISVYRSRELRLEALRSPGTPAAKPKDSVAARWQTPESLEILDADLSTREVAAKLGISLSHADRLRRHRKRSRSS